MNWKASLQHRRIQAGQVPLHSQASVRLACSPTSRWLGRRLTMMAVVFSVLAHVVLFAAFASEEDTQDRSIQQVVIIQNDTVKEEQAKKQEPLEPVDDNRILEPDPTFDEWVALGKPKGSDAEIEEQTAVSEQTAEEDKFGEEPELADEAPNIEPEEIYGLDLNSTIDAGAMAIRVGNSLRTNPGKYMDPSRVRPRSEDSGGTQGENRNNAPQMPEEPEEPQMPEPPSVPEPAEAPPAMSEMNRPEPPPNKPPPPKIVVPDEKYRKRVLPGYTLDAEDAEIEGTVVVDVWVSSDGTPKKAKVVSSLGYGLDEQAIRAAMASQYNPVLRSGKPAPCRYRLPYRFVLR